MSYLRVKHHTEANEFLNHLKRLHETLKFMKLDVCGNMYISMFEKAYLNISADLKYCQTGVIVGFFFDGISP